MKARKVKGLDPAKPLRRNAARIIRSRLEELHFFAAEALDPSAAADQHGMRIAAKRLRYVLEIVEGCFGPEARAARRAAKELQGVLGEIHDHWAVVRRYLTLDDNNGAQEVPLLEPRTLKTATKKAA